VLAMRVAPKRENEAQMGNVVNKRSLMAQTGKCAFLPTVTLIKSTANVGKLNPFKELFIVYRKVCPNTVSVLFRQCSFAAILIFAGKKGG
jgi:hypothetical protein